MGNYRSGHLTNEKDRTALVEFDLVGVRRGIRVEMNGFHVVRLDAAERILEGWGFTTDQEALDDFFCA
jgi:hypothetical protein